jgi:hypothetical protein
VRPSFQVAHSNTACACTDQIDTWLDSHVVIIRTCFSYEQLAFSCSLSSSQCVELNNPTSCIIIPLPLTIHRLNDCAMRHKTSFHVTYPE